MRKYVLNSLPDEAVSMILYEGAVAETKGLLQLLF